MPTYSKVDGLHQVEDYTKIDVLSKVNVLVYIYGEPSLPQAELGPVLRRAFLRISVPRRAHTGPEAGLSALRRAHRMISVPRRVYPVDAGLSNLKRTDLSPNQEPRSPRLETLNRSPKTLEIPNIWFPRTFLSPTPSSFRNHTS